MNEKEPFAVKTKNYVKDNMLVLTLVLICIVYVLKSLILIEPQEDLSIKDMILNTLLPTSMGLVISGLMVRIGATDGRKAKKFIDTLNTYGEVVSSIDIHYEYLEDYCDMKNARLLETTRKNFLRAKGISYEKYLAYIKTNVNIDNFDKQQLKDIKKAQKIKIFNMTPQYLTSECEYSKTTFKALNISRKIRQVDLSGLSTKIANGLLIGLFAIDTVKDFSIELLIWNLFQICLWVGLGILNYVKMYDYVTEEYRTDSIITKINLLTEFNNLITKHPKMFKPSLYQEEKGGITNDTEEDRTEENRTEENCNPRTD